MCKVNVVDAIMGAGKTTAAINFINTSDENKRFLYITPYLKEVDRIILECKSKGFRQPTNEKHTKLAHIKEMLGKGENIVSTHSLFHAFDEETIAIAYANNYTLIMDEVADVIEPYNKANKKDIKVMLENYARIANDGFTIEWIEEEYKESEPGLYTEIKRLCELNSMAIYGGEILVWLFPVKVFKAFREAYILTYMFDAQFQKYYFDLHNFEYNYIYVKDFNFIDQRIDYNKNNFVDLISIVENEKMNRIGDDRYALSASWYLRHNNKDNQLINILKNNLSNFFKNYSKTKTNLNLWTVFKDYKTLLSGKGYTKGYVSFNLRATNEYRDRTAVAYLINSFFNPIMSKFFVTNGVVVNEDKYALSEMLQFIWRSAIRDGKQIDLYIPSARMRNLLIDWMAAPSQLLDKIDQT